MLMVTIDDFLIELCAKPILIRKNLRNIHIFLRFAAVEIQI